MPRCVVQMDGRKAAGKGRAESVEHGHLQAWAARPPAAAAVIVVAALALTGWGWGRQGRGLQAESMHGLSSML
jgi:hypothetical protein